MYLERLANSIVGNSAKPVVKKASKARVYLGLLQAGNQVLPGDFRRSTKDINAEIVNGLISEIKLPFIKLANTAMRWFHTIV